MNKKLLVLLPAAMLMLASCGGGNTDPSKTDPSKTDPSTTSTTSETTSTTSETTSEEDLSKYGSLEAPLTVAQATAIMNEECTEDKKTTLHPMFVKGFVTDAATPSKYGWGNFHLGDTMEDENAVLVYTINKSDTVTKLAQNDELVLKGYGKLWGETLEIADGLEGETKVYPEALVRKAGTSSISVTVEHATVSELPTSAANDTELSFTVTPDANYKVVSVKAYDEKIEATEGTYTVELAGNLTIAIETADDAAPVAETITLDFTAENYGTIAEGVLTMADNSTYTVNSNVYANNGYLFLKSKEEPKGQAFVASVAATNKAIRSIEITTGSGASGSAKYLAFVGSSAITAAATDVTGEQNVGAGSTYEFKFTGEETYFAIQCTTDKYNGQLAKVVITLAV